MIKEKVKENIRNLIHHPPRRAIVRVLKGGIIGICSLVFFWLLGLIIPLTMGQNMGITEFGNLQPKNINKPLIVFHIYEIENSSNSIGFDLDSIVLPPNVCVDGITLFGGGSAYKLPYEDRPSFGGAFFNGSETYGGGVSDGAGSGDIGGYNIYGCSRNEQTWLHGYDLIRDKNKPEELKNIIRVNKQSSYYFPFDERSLSVFPYIGLYENSNEKKKLIDYEIVGWVTAPKSDEKIIIQKRKGKEPYVEVYFYQPIAYRSLTLILLGSLLLFISSLFFVTDNGTFLEVSVGILLGLWGIQDILVPKNITEPTIIDSFILTLYVLFIFITLIRFIRFNVWRWLNQIYRDD